MTYHELLKLYRNGELPEEQRKQIREDIEKQDAISEYLFEEGDLALLPEESGAAEDREAEGFAAEIRRSVRKAFVKMGIAVGAAVLALVLIAVFVLPKAVSLFYYDPAEAVGRNEYGNVTRRMDLDLAVYTELFLPGRLRDTVNSRPEGYGVYDLVIPQTVSINGRFTAVSGRLVRGRLTLYDTNTLRLPTGNAFRMPEGVQGGWLCTDENGEYVGPWGTRAEVGAHLAELDPREPVIGYVSLAEVTDYSTFMDWFLSRDLRWGSLWCAVYAEDGSGYPAAEGIGFSPRRCGTVLSFDGDAYPFLSVSEEGDSESVMTTHFISLLRYTQDHPALRDMLDAPGPDRYDALIDCVEKDGLRLYGFAISAWPDALQSLMEDPAVSYVYAQPLP